MTFQELTNFFRTEEENKDINENKFGEEDALFVKSEDTLVFALLQWADNQSNLETIDGKYLLIERLIKYINWNEVSKEVVDEFCLLYPMLSNSSKYSDRK